MLGVLFVELCPNMYVLECSTCQHEQGQNYYLYNNTKDILKSSLLLLCRNRYILEKLKKVLRGECRFIHSHCCYMLYGDGHNICQSVSKRLVRLQLPTTT